MKIFYLSTAQISMQYHPWYIFFLYTTDIFGTWMHFLPVNVMFYDTVSMIHDVITTANLFPYTAKFMFDCARNDKTQQMKRWKINRICIQCCHISKISDEVGSIGNFLALARKLSFLSTELDIFDIRQHYIHILYISKTWIINTN